MHLAEITTSSKEEAVSFLAGVAFTDDSSHDVVGVKPDDGSDDRWIAVVINYDAQTESKLDEELEAAEHDPVKLYLDKYPLTEMYDSAGCLATS